MYRVLHDNTTDKRITYTGDWKGVPNENKILTTLNGFVLSIPFTAIAFHLPVSGSPTTTGGTLILFLDGGPRTITVLLGTVGGRVTPMHYVDDIEDGDHELMGPLSQLEGGAFGMDFVNCVVPLLHSAQEQHSNSLATYKIGNSLERLRASQCQSNCAERPRTGAHYER